MSIDPNLMSRIRVDSSCGCWIWQGGKTLGYGVVHIPSHKWQRKAHRVFFEQHYDVSLEGKILCHSCDTPLCVNPSHMFVGTHSDNHADMCAKGRNAHGSMLPQTKLTPEQVAEIRASCEPAGVVAERYRITRQWVWKLRRGLWRKDAAA